MWAKIAQFDAHPKTKDEFRVRTLQGGVSTLVAIFVALWLVRTEMRHTLQVTTTDRLFVNSSHGASVSVTFAIEFPKIACELIAVDAMDQAGQPMRGFEQHVVKKGMGEKAGKRLKKEIIGSTAIVEAHLTENQEGCGDCYGALPDGECCNTCDSVRAAYKLKGWTFHQHLASQCREENSAAEELLALASGDEGCELSGSIVLPSVAGNFHFAPGRQLSRTTHTASELLALTFAKFDVSHTIKHISFDHDVTEINNGKKRAKRKKKQSFKKKPAALHSQLDGESRTVSDGQSMHQYYLKVVPTTFRPLGGTSALVSQYSVTEHQRHASPGAGRGLPGVFFYYEVSPLCAEFVESRAGFGAFLTGLSAIVGGVYVTAGILDRCFAALMETSFAKPAAKHLAGSRSTLLD